MERASPVQTPEFLCWAIEWRCPLRDLLPENDPEKVERQLRNARAVSEARAEGRVQNDLVVSADERLGFRVADAMAIYGGEAVVAECCNACPANVKAGRGEQSYAGCYGLLPMPEPRAEFVRCIQKSTGDQGLFPPIQRSWYGWWIHSPLVAKQLAYLASVFRELASAGAFAEHPSLAEFTAALERCVKNGLLMSVQLFPAGEVVGTQWNLRPHCPVCRAPWVKEGGVCAMCGQSRHPASEKKRKARGTRPYRPLEELT
jgi:hypothetical protein